MKTVDIIEKIKKCGIIPVAVINDIDKAVPLADALLEGGLGCIEITFRNTLAVEAIRAVAINRPDMLIGAGTVLSKEQADAAMDAGASFIVSPGFDPEIVDYCMAKGYLVIPGCMTPSELTQAVKRKLKIVKFFPAEQAGGLDMIKALAAPFKDIAFMATGGINEKNVASYLAYDKLIACGGSWMVKAELVDAGQFEEIKRMSKEASDIVNKVRQ